MSENELSQDYIKGFIDALEIVVKSFRNIQFNSQSEAREQLDDKSSRANGVQDSCTSHSDKSNSIKDSLDKDYKKGDLQWK